MVREAEAERMLSTHLLHTYEAISIDLAIGVTLVHPLVLGQADGALCGKSD